LKVKNDQTSRKNIKKEIAIKILLQFGVSKFSEVVEKIIFDFRLECTIPESTRLER